MPLVTRSTARPGRVAARLQTPHFLAAAGWVAGLIDGSGGDRRLGPA